jgi:uncharacterized protein YggE
MTRFMVPACVLTLTVLAGPAAAQVSAVPPDGMGPSTVVTRGEGIVRAAPDVAFFTVSAEQRASNPREAQQRAADAMRPVLERLLGNDVPADDIRTVNYDVQPDYEFADGRRVLRGYIARNAAEVRLPALDRLGEMLAIVVTAGATSVGGIRFDVADRVSLEREALRLAVADARARADAAAAGAGMTVARVLRVEEEVAVGEPVFQTFAAAREMAADVPPIAAGPLDVRAQVTLQALLR